VGIAFGRISSSYWIDNLGFLLREKLAAIFITPCSWGFPTGRSFILHQLGPISGTSPHKHAGYPQAAGPATLTATETESSVGHLLALAEAAGGCRHRPRRHIPRVACAIVPPPGGPFWQKNSEVVLFDNSVVQLVSFVKNSGQSCTREKIICEKPNMSRTPGMDVLYTITKPQSKLTWSSERRFGGF
jgi:hypothetical protein